jgi:mannose/cellobiose epimerase-like protein (N-acyl-D-glucosamine 2-epimerase family)
MGERLSNGLGPPTLTPDFRASPSAAAPTAFRASAHSAMDWLTKHAFPVWLEHGVDWRRGAFFDALSPATLKNATEYKRLRVLCRQIYVFSYAASLNFPGARDAVHHGLDFLLGPARLPAGGFATRFTLEGRVLSKGLDLYDLAFALFALAHGYALLKDTSLQEEAEALLLFIGASMRHRAGGFVEGIPAALPRRQNPHMHLLEACLAWVGNGVGGCFAEFADELAMLFATQFFQPGEGVLLEYFDADLAPAAKRIVEPGHHFEWIWLLRQYSSLREKQSFPIEALYDFAMRHGVDQKTGMLFGEVSPTGATLTPACRLWPHTEWLKAELVRDGEPSWQPALRAARQLHRFLDEATPGLWHERWNPEAGGFLEEPSPASSLYHIVLAFSEMARVAASPARKEHSFTE